MKKFFHGSNWLLTLPLAAIGIAYLYFFFLPAKKEIGHLRDELKAKQAAITSAQPTKLTIHRTQQELNAVKDYVSQWQSQNQIDAAMVLAQISDSVQQAGTRTIHFDPEKTVSYQTVRKTPLVLGSAGDFAQIFEMLRRIEALNATIWIDQLRIEAGGEGEGALSNELTLGIFAVNPSNSD